MSSAIGQKASPINISYTITFPEAQAHYADVEMDITGLHQKALDLKMPVWTPGSYLVREYSKNVESFTAEAQGKSVEAKKTRKNIWMPPTKGPRRTRILTSCWDIYIS